MHYTEIPISICGQLLLLYVDLFVCVIGNVWIVALYLAWAIVELWTQLLNPFILRHLTIVSVWVDVTWIYYSNLINLITLIQGLCPIVQLSNFGRTFKHLGIIGDRAALLLHCASDRGSSFTLMLHVSSLDTTSLVPYLNLLILQRELSPMYRDMSVIIIAQCLLAMIHLIHLGYPLVPLL